MTILYFPGFGGNQNSETFRKIVEKHESSELIIYNNFNAEKAFEEIQNQIENYLSENILLIGQSLGGFWAEYFAVKFGFNLILINPSLEPHESLKKYDLSAENLNSFKKFKTEKLPKSKISIILSKNDTVVNPKPVFEKYKDFVDFKYIEGDHKLTEFETLFREIEKMKSEN